MCLSFQHYVEKKTTDAQCLSRPVIVRHAMLAQGAGPHFSTAARDNFGCLRGDRRKSTGEGGTCSSSAATTFGVNFASRHLARHLQARFAPGDDRQVDEQHQPGGSGRVAVLRPPTECIWPQRSPRGQSTVEDAPSCKGHAQFFFIEA